MVGVGLRVAAVATSLLCTGCAGASSVTPATASTSAGRGATASGSPSGGATASLATAAEDAPAGCPDIAAALSRALHTRVVFDPENAVISDARPSLGDVSCAWKTPDRLWNKPIGTIRLAAAFAVLIRPHADWALESSNYLDTKLTPLPALGPQAGVISSTNSSATGPILVVAETPGKVFIRSTLSHARPTLERDVPDAVAVVRAVMNAI